MDTLQAQRLTTANLINAYPTVIALVRQGTWVSDGEGGQVRLGGTSIKPPVARFLRPVSRDAILDVDTEGDRVLQWYILIGEWTDDIQKDDTFNYNGNKLTVRRVHEERSFQVRAEVAHYGKP